MQLNIKTEVEIEINDMDTSVAASTVVPTNVVNTKPMDKSFIFSHLTDTKSIVNIDDITSSPPKNPIPATITRPKAKRAKSQQIYKCDICIKGGGNCAEKIFTTKYMLHSHMSTHSIKLRTCEICSRTYSDSESGVELHMATYHGTIAIEKSNECQSIEEQMLKCDVCDKKFHWDHQLQYHKNVHRDNKPIPCTLCPKKFVSSIGMKRHLQTHNVPLHRCATCPAKFQTAKEMRDHRIGCEATNIVALHKFVCPNCGRTFASRNGLSLHANLKKCHLNGKYVFFCTACGRKFLTQFGLNVHKSKRLCFK